MIEARVEERTYSKEEYVKNTVRVLLQQEIKRIAEERMRGAVVVAVNIEGFVEKVVKEEIDIGEAAEAFIERVTTT